MSIRKYGTSNDEKILQESLEAKQIVKEILTYGVSQKQLMYIINDLALNLENMDHCRRLVNLLNELAEDDISNLSI